MAKRKIENNAAEKTIQISLSDLQALMSRVFDATFSCTEQEFNGEILNPIIATTMPRIPGPPYIVKRALADGEPLFLLRERMISALVGEYLE